MLTPRILTCLAIAALAPLVQAQTPTTAYTITQALADPSSGTMTIYRNGAQVMVEYRHPDKPQGTPGYRTLTLYDLKAGVSHSWDPSGTPVTCSAGTFTGDWGDPFAATAEVTADVAKGDLKPAGAETLNGIPTKVYAGATQGANIKAWLDEKDGLVIKAAYGAPGGPMQNMVDIRSFTKGPPAATAFASLPACVSVHPPPTAAELIAAETGDSADNFVNANYGPGSKASCSILIRVVAAKTMAPVNRNYQVAIDTTYNQDSPTPPHYEFGVGNDGTATFSGGGLHEITNQIHNGMLRIDHVPSYFNLSMNIPQPNHGAGMALIYRLCVAPVTVLYYVVKDPADPGQGGDWLYAKAGKYAAVPAQ
jgi:hypothetical protein